MLILGFSCEGVLALHIQISLQRWTFLDLGILALAVGLFVGILELLIIGKDKR